MEFSGQTLVGESAWDSEVLPGVLIINVLIKEFSGLGLSQAVGMT